MTALLVAAWVLVATTPWWVARSAVGRRVVGVARRAASAGGPPDGAWGEGERGTGRGGRGRPDDAGTAIETGVLLELLAAAVRSGAAVPRALDVVGSCVGGRDGSGLRAAGAALLLGASWDAAWVGAPPRLAVVQRALRPAWLHGAAPAPALRAAAQASRQDRTAAAKTAAARLAVHLVLPLGACFLPAFVLVGLVPVLVSLGSGLLGG
ncbi:type II secretion system F family protein [Cellulosimicrobium sp. SH8]|uniref:type II secretion system F family protein n=1 Tax=Cellulosimicrobium sp. SH8 TaxID=2952936 RepID=UPI0021F2DAF0|nr:type II secretion system F family protein [Cellulosimicrobium sp. SH8]